MTKQLLEILQDKFPEAEASPDEMVKPEAININAEFLNDICNFLHRDENHYFDMLSCITGIDNGPEENSMEVAYNLYSIPFSRQLTLKVKLQRHEEALKLQTVSGIWKSALWLEREVYDLLGIYFDGHPDLRRILLPSDWVGYPLRKDYKDLETYHGIVVK